METILPSILSRPKSVDFNRNRIELSDGDFIDVDKLQGGFKRCLVLSHGLEGGSHRYYVARTAEYFFNRGWDVVAWNCRSCSGEMNRLPRFYHHGDTQDLRNVIETIDHYEKVVLLGYLMGGSLTLKYLGEGNYPKSIIGAVTFSVPCNLKDSSETLALKRNRFYEQRFLGKLIKKIKLKSIQFPSLIEGIDLDEIKDFEEFHRIFTVPLHGFSDLEDFFSKSTCDQYFSKIEVPALIVNAMNDPLLGGPCYPVEEALRNPNLFLEIPERGGHTGFTLKGQPHSWMEERAESFIRDILLPNPS